MTSSVPARVRGLVKSAVAQALSWSRADALIGLLATAGDGPVVIGYHRVVDDFRAAAGVAIPAMLTSRQMLEAQLDWIGRRFRFVSLDDLGRELSEGAPAGRPAAAVTFDDGYRDVYEQAFPILERKGIPAGVFIVTDLVGTGQAQVHDRLFLLARRAFSRWPDPARELGRLLAALEIQLTGIERLARVAEDPLSAVVTLLRTLSRADVERVAEAIEADVGGDIAPPAPRGFEPLTWDMLAEMARAGVTVGSHTRTHAWLTLASPDEVSEELGGSRAEIERRIGVKADHFAYPDGRFDTATVEAVARAGYRFGYTTCTHRDARSPLLTIPRRMLWEHACVDAVNRFSPAILSCNLHGVWSLVSGCGQEHTS